MRVRFCSAFITLSFLVPVAASAQIQPILSIGNASEQSSPEITVPILLQQPHGSKLDPANSVGFTPQSLGLSIKVLPRATVTNVLVRPAGVTASLTPLFKRTMTTRDGAALILQFDERKDPLRLHGNGPEIIAEIVLRIAPDAAGSADVRV